MKKKKKLLITYKVYFLTIKYILNNLESKKNFRINFFLY